MTEVEVKERVRRRDGYACTECGMTQLQHLRRFGKALEVHRKRPGSVYTVRGCQTLCRKCHGPKPRTPSGVVRAGHKQKPLFLDAEHFLLLSELAARAPRPVVWELRIAVDNHLRANGIEPPPWRNPRSWSRKRPS